MNEPNKAFHLTFGNNPPRTMFLRLYKSFGFHVDFYVFNSQEKFGSSLSFCCMNLAHCDLKFTP